MIRRETEYIILETREDARNRSEKGVFKEENLSCTKEQEKNANNNTSITHKKVVDVNIENSVVEGYRLIDMTILAKLIGELSCPECHDDQSKLIVCTDTSTGIIC